MNELLKDIDQESVGLAKKLANHLLEKDLLWKSSNTDRFFWVEFCTFYGNSNIGIGVGLGKAEKGLENYYCITIDQESFRLPTEILEPLFNKAKRFWNSERKKKILQKAEDLKTKLERLTED